MAKSQERTLSPGGWKEIINEVREILTILARTISASKIFPPNHASVRQFTQELGERLGRFLENHGNLDLTIGENYFEYEGELVFEDEDTARSLPFFFFRDGMQRLSFHRGLREEELHEFLESIRTVAFLPPEEADIVTALWERNFENISFYAPDEFLIEKIAAGRPLPKYEVDSKALFSGRIELAAEDREAIEAWRSRIPEAEEEGLPSDSAAAALVQELSSDLKEDEWKAIEIILQGHRNLPPDEEFARLLIEILYLEDRTEQLPLLQDSLGQCHQQLIKAGKFGAAAAFLHDLLNFQKIFSSDSPEKARLIEAFFQEIKGDAFHQVVREAYLKHAGHLEKEGFFNYLQSLGQEGLRVLVSLYETPAGSQLEEISLPFLETWARKEPEALMPLAHESRPFLTRHIIRLLSQQPDRKIVSFLAGFMSSSSVALKKEALESLARMEIPAAKKILVGFLNDEKEEVRVLAAESLQVSDESILDHLLHYASLSRIKKKSPREAEALLSALARSEDPKAMEYFRQLFRRRLFLGPKLRRLSLLAIAALKKAGTPQAWQLLEDGKGHRNATIRRACQEALEKLRAESTQAGGSP